MAIVDLSKQGYKQAHIHFQGTAICLKDGQTFYNTDIINQFPQYFKEEPVVEIKLEEIVKFNKVEPIVEPVEEILTEDSSDVEITEEVTEKVTEEVVEEVVEAPVKKTKAKK